MSLGFSLNQSQQQKQVQKLSQRLIQRFQDFQLSVSDLEVKAVQMASETPFLKLSMGTGALPKSTPTGSDASESVDQFDFISSSESLQSLLLKQLDLESVNSKDKEIITELIDHLDGKGYLPTYSELRERLCKDHVCESRKIDACLKIVQSFEPDGVGARSLKECLLIQVQAYEFEDTILQAQLTELIQTHLEAVGEGNTEAILSAMSIEIDELEALLLFVKSNLTHNPAQGYATEAHYVQTVRPSFRIQQEDDVWKIINLEDTEGMKVSFDEALFQKQLHAARSKEEKLYLTQQFEKVKQFVQTVQDRRQRLESLVEFMISHQKAYLSHGEAFIQPLLQKELAQKFSFSPSMISRLLSSKYIETPHGIIPLKTLSPRRYFGHSRYKFEQLIRTICEAYPDKSDLDISRYLLSECGIKIARRTVAKYRLALGYPSKGKNVSK
tara:strand:+ start:192 stop:1517 length:1326 start_codon:yes stop_codon:yes gene_type:complete